MLNGGFVLDPEYFGFFPVHFPIILAGFFHAFQGLGNSGFDGLLCKRVLFPPNYSAPGNSQGLGQY